MLLHPFVSCYNSAMTVPIIKATKCESREYINEKGETCRDVIVHVPILSLRKKVGEARANQIVQATTGKKISPVIQSLPSIPFPS